MNALQAPPGHGHGRVQDPDRARVIVIGGRNRSNYGLSTTYEWDGHDWSANGCPLQTYRVDTAVVYDAAARRLMLYGGYLDLAVLSDSWFYGGLQTPGTAALGLALSDALSLVVGD